MQIKYRLPQIFFLLKQYLANYNSILDGRRQQDAHECFLKILDIMHAGTKFALIEDSNLTEEYIMSYSKQMFSSISSVM